MKIKHVIFLNAVKIPGMDMVSSLSSERRPVFMEALPTGFLNITAGTGSILVPYSNIKQMEVIGTDSLESPPKSDSGRSSKEKTSSGNGGKAVKAVGKRSGKNTV